MTVDVSPRWAPFEDVQRFVPPALLSWLTEPGLLTARIRALCGEGMHFRMLGPLRRVSLAPELQVRLGIGDNLCWLREIDFSLAGTRLVYAQTVLPEATVTAFPWLRELGEAPLGEALRQAAGKVEREPLEYAELASSASLARAAVGEAGGEPEASTLWSRRAVYRLESGQPLLVQEVFLPALLQVQARLRAATEEIAR